MKIAYFDCFSGASGDMILGALVDCGLPLEHLQSLLQKIQLPSFEIKCKQVEKSGLPAIKIDVLVKEKGLVRYFSNITSLINESHLKKSIKENGIRILETLARAEASIHRQKIDQVHFHEVGAIDSIIDVIGAVIGFDYFEVEKIYSSPLATGLGQVKTDHGVLPIPTPATLEILKDVPIYSKGIPAELVTPTGAAIIKTLASSFGSLPSLKIKEVGYGAGSKDLEMPNALRLIIGESESVLKEQDEVILLQTNLDDLNPEFYEYIIEKLFINGALDVWLDNIQMKKNRPGIILSVLCPPNLIDKLTEIIFQETSTLGVRQQNIFRQKAIRKILEIETEFGKVRIKVGRFGLKAFIVSPEYEDCARIAKEQNKPVREIYDYLKELAISKIDPKEVLKNIDN